MAEHFIPSADPTTLDPAFLSTAIDNLKETASNASVYFSPYPKDLLFAIPRLASRVGSFWLVDIPEHVDHIFGAALRGSIIAEATAGGPLTNEAVAAASASLQNAGVPAAPLAGGNVENVFVSSWGFQNIRGIGGMFSYLTSKWALWCFMMVCRCTPLSEWSPTLSSRAVG